MVEVLQFRVYAFVKPGAPDLLHCQQHGLHKVIPALSTQLVPVCRRTPPDPNTGRKHSSTGINQQGMLSESSGLGCLHIQISIAGAAALLLDAACMLLDAGLLTSRQAGKCTHRVL